MIKKNAQPIKLPEDLKRAIEKVRVQLEINKSELGIMQKARFSEEGSVEQLIRNRKFLEKKNDELDVEVKEKSGEVERIREIIKEKQGEFNIINGKVEKSAEELKDIREKEVAITSSIEERELDIIERASDISKKEKVIEIKERDVDEKLKNFKEFVNKIK